MQIKKLTGNLDRTVNTTMAFVLGKARETIKDFSNNPVKVL